MALTFYPPIVENISSTDKVELLTTSKTTKISRLEAVFDGEGSRTIIFFLKNNDTGKEGIHIKQSLTKDGIYDRDFMVGPNTTISVQIPDYQEGDKIDVMLLYGEL